MLHRDRAGFGNILEKEDRMEGVGLQSYWQLSDSISLYHRKLTHRKGDLLVFLCALVFSLHILVIDYFAPKADGVKMSCIQFFVCGILSLPVMFLTETPAIEGIIAGWFPLFYAGVLSCGVAYTLQIVGQKDMNPAVAALILSLESCFSVLAGWALLGEQMSTRETIGCVLMFAAIILAQLPEKEKIRNKK